MLSVLAHLSVVNGSHAVASICSTPSKVVHGSEHRSTDAPHPCDKLYAVIKKSPRIAAIIRELSIQDRQPPWPQSWITPTHSLVLLLDSLTHLGKSRLSGIEWITITPELRGAFRRIFASNPITSLELDLCGFPVKSFIYLFGSCSNMKSLVVGNVNFRTSKYYPKEFKLVEDEEARNVGEEMLPRKCQLDTLQIIRCHSETLTSNPESAFDLRRLRTLHCRIDQAAKTLLHKLGGSLHHVVVWWPTYLEKCELFESVLDSNSGLQSLHVMDIRHPHNGKTILRMKGLLQSISGAPHLQKIEMKVNVTYELEHLDDVDWSAWSLVDEIFDGAAFPELVKVDFKFYNSERVDWRCIGEAMDPFFPCLAKRGVLAIR